MPRKSTSTPKGNGKPGKKEVKPQKNTIKSMFARMQQMNEIENRSSRTVVTASSSTLAVEEDGDDVVILEEASVSVTSVSKKRPSPPASTRSRPKPVPASPATSTPGKENLRGSKDDESSRMSTLSQRTSSTAYGSPPLMSRAPIFAASPCGSSTSTVCQSPFILSRNPMDIPKGPTAFTGLVPPSMTTPTKPGPKKKGPAGRKAGSMVSIPSSVSGPASPLLTPSSPSVRVHLSPKLRFNPKRYSLSQSMPDVSVLATPPHPSSPRVSFMTTPTAPGSPSFSQVQSTSRKRFVTRRSSSFASPTRVKKSLDFSPQLSIPSFGEQVKELGKRRYRHEVGIYLQTFQLVIDAVFAEKNASFVDGLFTDEEKEIVDKFLKARLAPRKLYVRIFERKWAWHDPNDISYLEIADDLIPHFEDLAARGLFDKGPLFDGTVESLGTLLDGMSAPAVRELCQNFKLKTESSKEKNVEALQKHCRTYRKSLFGSQRSTVDIIAEKVLNSMGTRYRINEKAADVFKRVFLLFFPPDFYADATEEASLVKAQLLRIRQVHWDKLSFPPVQPMRATRLFRDREDFVAYCNAHSKREEMWKHFESPDYEAAVKLIPSLRAELEALLENEEAKLFVTNLPSFLRRYCVGAVLCSTLTTAADACEKKKDYEQAVDVLRFLLNQTIFLTDYRGRWFERLALNLQAHLKRNDEAIDALAEALSDPYVRFARRRAIQTRAKTLLQKAYKLKQQEEEKKKKANNRNGRGRGRARGGARNTGGRQRAGNDEDAAIAEDIGIAEGEAAKKYTQWQRKLIRGDEVLPCGIPSWNVDTVYCRRTEGATGRKATYLYNTCDANGGLVSNYCSVEEVALKFYETQGHENGIHGEGRIWGTIFGLIFWDILYKPLPDAFLTEYQSVPSDLNSDEFYERRKEDIEDRLKLIRDDMDAALDIAREIWDEHAEKSTQSLVSWGDFRDYDHLEGLIETLGPIVVAGVCERLAKNYRFTRSGLPDLVVWSTNPDDQKYVIAEVKGPGDTLSEKQELWLEYLTTKLKATAKVCEVKDKKGVAPASPDEKRPRKRPLRAGTADGDSNTPTRKAPRVL